MACATISLKRSLDFDPLSARRSKRRRCIPMTLGHGAMNSTSSPAKPPSVFQAATPSLSKEQLAASITTEIRRLRRRRSRPTSTAQTSQSDSSDGEQLSSNSSTTSVTMSQSTAQQSKDNTPLFTFKQMTILCERMMKERTDKLCEEYDQVLSTKLAEQYEAFLKFNHDQVQRHFSNSSDASYLS